MKITAVQKGKEVEQKALDWLLVRGFRKHLISNYRCKGGEIDHVFEEFQLLSSEWELVFVEVRYRAPQGWIDGIESITPQKRLRLIRAARHFLAHYQGRCKSIRFDVLYWDGLVWTHLQAAWTG